MLPTSAFQILRTTFVATSRRKGWEHSTAPLSSEACYPQFELSTCGSYEGSGQTQARDTVRKGLAGRPLRPRDGGTHGDLTTGAGRRSANQCKVDNGPNGI